MWMYTFRVLFCVYVSHKHYFMYVFYIRDSDAKHDPCMSPSSIYTHSMYVCVCMCRVQIYRAFKRDRYQAITMPSNREPAFQLCCANVDWYTHTHIYVHTWIYHQTLPFNSNSSSQHTYTHTYVCAIDSLVLGSSHHQCQSTSPCYHPCDHHPWSMFKCIVN